MSNKESTMTINNETGGDNNAQRKPFEHNTKYETTSKRTNDDDEHNDEIDGKQSTTKLTNIIKMIRPNYGYDIYTHIGHQHV